MAQNPVHTEPLLNQFQYTYEKDSVTIFGSMIVDGSLGEVGSFEGLGIESIEKSDPPVAASFSGQVPGMTTDVVITADNAGAAGNITLTGDGVSTVQDLIDAWNLANPSNTVSLTSGDGSQVPSNLEDIDLTGGSDGTAGQYDLVLLDNFNKLMEEHVSSVKASASSVAKVQVLLAPATMQSNIRSLSSKLLVLQCYDYAGSAVNPADGEGLLIRVVLRNSSLNAPTG